MPLGNLIQSKCCLFYLSPYVSKNKVDIQHALQTLDQARKYVEKHPSRAEDSGSIIRTTQHWLTRFLNALDNTMEVADTQAVGALFNLDTEICSECFVYVGIHEAYQYLHDHRNNNSTDKNNNFDIVCEDDKSFIINSDDKSDNSFDPTERDDSSMDSASINNSFKQKNGININKNWDSTTIYQIKENDDITPVSVYF